MTYLWVHPGVAGTMMLVYCDGSSKCVFYREWPSLACQQLRGNLRQPLKLHKVNVSVLNTHDMSIPCNVPSCMALKAGLASTRCNDRPPLRMELRFLLLNTCVGTMIITIYSTCRQRQHPYSENVFEQCPSSWSQLHQLTV